MSHEQVVARRGGVSLGTASDLRLCFVGDSFVVGTGDPEGLGWVGRACAPLRGSRGLTVYNLGVRGETSEAMARRAPGEVASRWPQRGAGRIALSFGMNDTSWEGDGPRVPLAESLAHASALVVGWRAASPVLVVGPPPVAEPRQAERLGALTRGLASLCAARAALFIPIFDALLASAAWMGELAAGDGMHPGAGGYADLARIVAGAAEWEGWLGGMAR